MHIPCIGFYIHIPYHVLYIYHTYTRIIHLLLDHTDSLLSFRSGEPSLPSDQMAGPGTSACERRLQRIDEQSNAFSNTWPGAEVVGRHSFVKNSWWNMKSCCTLSEVFDMLHVYMFKYTQILCIYIYVCIHALAPVVIQNSDPSLHGSFRSCWIYIPLGISCDVPWG